MSYRSMGALGMDENGNTVGGEDGSDAAQAINFAQATADEPVNTEQGYATATSVTQNGFPDQNVAVSTPQTTPTPVQTYKPASVPAQVNPGFNVASLFTGSTPWIIGGAAAAIAVLALVGKKKHDAHGAHG